MATMTAILHHGGADEAADLVRHVQSCVNAGAARHALLVRLSLLPPDLVRPHHLRMAREAIEPLLMADRVRLFALPNADHVVIWRGDESETLARVTAELTLMFSDTQPALDLATMIVSLMLPAQAETLLRAARESVAGAAPPRPAADERAPLDLAALARLETSLAQTDVAPFARRAPILERREDGGFATRWEKRYLSAADISAALMPDRAIQADPWLFRRLSRTLDRRMLALLAAPEELRDAGPLSLNLNVATILAPDFLRFDRAIPSTMRGRVILELRVDDVVSDPSAFLFARDFAKSRGYRLLLRGLTAELVLMFPRARLGVDLLRLRWNAGLATALTSALGEDAGTVVLAAADTPDALAWGQAHGIRLYQRS